MEKGLRPFFLDSLIETLNIPQEMIMAQRILIMGLPGAGKTTLAEALREKIWQEGRTVSWFNADDVRRKHNDWDFSATGRMRQAERMRTMSDEATTDYVICDFVAPLIEMRNVFKADWTIWVDTIQEGRYADTNKAFIEPEIYDFRITEQNAEKWSDFICDHIVNNRRRPRWDNKKETVQMLGRWQPWHDGHRALFERLLAKTGQVVIQVRDVQGWQDSNPFNFFDVVRFIKRDLDPLYQGQYDIMLVPNIVHIGWGRGVGYTAGEETFDESITDISATKIRKQLGLK
jgi:adenylate kinase family enzyme